MDLDWLRPGTDFSVDRIYGINKYSHETDIMEMNEEGLVWKEGLKLIF